MRFIVLLILISGLVACGEDPPMAPPDPGPSIDELVIANCLAVKELAEAYYADNGDWPEHYHFRDLLPDRKLLPNPVTGQNTEPLFHRPDGVGSTSYRAVYYYDEYAMYTAGYIIIGGLESGDTTFTNAPDSLVQLDERTIENCHIVQAAAEAFAADNGGVYATDNATRNPLGRTIQSYLPGGQLLMNPYWEIRTEPTWGAVAASAGGSGYVGVDPDGDGIMDGYFIDGLGGDGVSIICQIEAKNALVHWACDKLRDAVAAWVTDAGTFPLVLESRTPDGKTVLDYLPDGKLLENPFTGKLSEPANGPATEPGDVGYIALYGGYRIEGFGVADLTFSYTVNPVKWSMQLDNVATLRDALEAWRVEDNNGKYPHNINSITSTGKYLVDLLPGGQLLENPYTGMRSEPGGASHQAGSIRFQQWGHLTRFGYQITAWGGNAEDDYRVYSSLHNVLVQQAGLVERGLNDFAALNGNLYPWTFQVTLPDGRTLLDMMPDPMPINKFTGEPSVLVLGRATAVGEFGYVPLQNDDNHNTGYQIDAVDPYGNVVVNVWKRAR